MFDHREYECFFLKGLVPEPFIRKLTYHWILLLFTLVHKGLSYTGVICRKIIQRFVFIKKKSREH